MTTLTSTTPEPAEAIAHPASSCPARRPQAGWRRLVNRWLGDWLFGRSESAARAAYRRAGFNGLAPVSDKTRCFAGRSLEEVCPTGALRRSASVYTSSGHSGVFSFGVESRADERRLIRRVDRLLNLYFQTRSRATLLINALPPGVRIPSRSVTVFEASSQPRAVLAALERVAPAFDQVVLVAEQPLLKHVAECAVLAGIDFQQLIVHAITGGAALPAGYRDYVGRLLGHGQPGGGDIWNSYGVSEVSLSLGQETPDSRAILQASADDPVLRDALFGDAPFLPTFVQYDPRGHGLETLEPGTDDNPGDHPIVAMTALDRRRPVDLIRYTPGDWSRVYSPRRVREALKSAGREDLTPGIPLPFLAVWGRGRGLEVAAGRTLYPEQVREAIFADAELAA
ncbi:MAG: phenylacetate--CoA ligase family protein, partial [Planctomycetota bacterium]